MTLMVISRFLLVVQSAFFQKLALSISGQRIYPGPVRCAAGMPPLNYPLSPCYTKGQVSIYSIHAWE